jgi:radical SAM protein with 4Fe4S-binding SPASM domain
MEAETPVAFDGAPRIVIWEMTRACSLACRHCRAEAIPARHPDELATDEAFALVDQVAECGAPLFILTGGDPLMRNDLFDIVAYAVQRGLPVAVSPSATGRLTANAIRRLAAAGCRTISLSLDAPDADTHDAFRGVKGSFLRTLAAADDAREYGVRVQVNTTLARHDVHLLREFVPLLHEVGAAAWSVFALIPVGRAAVGDMLTADELEAALLELHDIASRLSIPVKTTEAPQYRRIRIQRADAGGEPRASWRPGIGDGRGFVFVSHVGDVQPSGFFPTYTAGNVRQRRLLDLYRNYPAMRRLRRPETFEGKCGRCEFRNVCGGSRARAAALTGNPFASDPGCPYLPLDMRS